MMHGTLFGAGHALRKVRFLIWTWWYCDRCVKSYGHEKRAA